METLVGRQLVDYVLRMKLERSDDDITCGMFSILWSKRFNITSVSRSTTQVQTVNFGT